VLPGFFIGGTQKGGTTTLHWRLKEHPDVFIPDFPQEIHFFDDDAAFARGLGWYERLFAGHRGERAVGQTSPLYLYAPEVPERIHAVIPRARFLFSLRDPVDRAYAHYWHSVKKGYEGLDFEAALAAEPARIARGGTLWRDHSYVDRGRYAGQLRRFFERFGRERVLVLFQDELAADPARVEAACARFLEVDPAAFPPRRVTAHNVSQLPRSRRLQRAVGPWRRSLPRVAAAIDRLNLRTAPYPPLDPALRIRLARLFEPEIRELEGLLGIDLHRWRRAADAETRSGPGDSLSVGSRARSS
jgi:hypothetical protein